MTEAEALAEARRRLFPTCRVFTGNGVSRGYIYDRTTGRPAWACPHRHRSRRHREYSLDGVRRRTSSASYAQACAESVLRREQTILAFKILAVAEKE